MSSAPADLERTLAAIERPNSHRMRVGGVSLLGRAKAAPAVRRLTPRGAAVRRAEDRGRRRWEESPGTRKKASRWMEDMRGLPAGDPEAQRLGRAAVLDAEVRLTMQSRHWEAGHGPVHGLERMKRARARGRGVLVAGLHVGVLLNAPVQIAAQYEPYYLVRALRRGERQGASALVIKQRMVAMERVGLRWVERKNSYPVVRALLERGEMCGLMFDSSGNVETELMGRRTWLAGGLAALACETGAPIVLGYTLREGDGHACYVEEPIDAADFAGPEEVHRHLAGVCSRVLLDNLIQFYPRRLPAQPRSG